MASKEAVNFTDDIKIEPSSGFFLVVLNEATIALPPPHTPTVQSLKLALPKTTGKKGTKGKSGKSGAEVAAPTSIDAPLAVEAEDYIERTLRTKYGKSLRRIGHTSFEYIPLKDGGLPGADLVVEDKTGKLLRCIEVKSAKASLPSSIRLTASEYARAIKCKIDTVPYDLYVVVFNEKQQVPRVSTFLDFHTSISELTISDLSGMDIRIAKA